MSRAKTKAEVVEVKKGESESDPSSVIVKITREPELHLARRQFTRNYYSETEKGKHAYAVMSAAKANLMHSQPFLGFIAMDLVLVECEAINKKLKIDTAGTDGFHIFYSADFVHSLNEKQVEFLMAHEIYHCILNHTQSYDKLIRVSAEMDKDVSNIAMDFVINNYLIEEGIGEKIPPPNGEEGCYNSEFSGWSFEAVYDYLLKNPDLRKKCSCFDQHIEIILGKDGEDDKNKSGSGFKVFLSKDEFESIKDDLLDALQKANIQMNQMGAGAGNVPEFIKRILDTYNAPKIRWQDVCRKFVVSVIKTGYSFTTPDKKTFGSGIIIPGYKKRTNKIEIAVAFDTSGSVGQDQLIKFFSEFRGIMKGFRAYSIHAFCFEGDVAEKSYMHITGSTQNVEHDFKEYIKHIEGGGGTCFNSVWEFMINKKIRPKGLVFFTDGYPCDDEWEDKGKYCPTLFVTVGNDNNWKAPFGKTIAYEEAA